jgi:hypothetical protein
MTVFIAMLAIALFLAGGITGVLATLAIGIHTHSRAQHPASNPPAHIHATRRILGVGSPSNHTRR